LTELKNKREFPRKNASITAAFDFGGKTLTGSVEDLSAGGLFIRLDDDVAIGEKIRVNLSYLNLDEPFSVQAEVVSKRNGGIGIKFNGLTQTQKDLLSFLYW
jgi:hypothetical protein